MKGTSLGEFEELVLLAVGLLYKDAYGLGIKELLDEKTGRKITISSVHKSLVRLEKKGFITSHMGGATEERGGRQKRLFQITATGKAAIIEARELRNSLFSQIPEMAWNI
jgi:PadR family transcriptional regulator, regulatory protein PadR